RTHEAGPALMTASLLAFSLSDSFTKVGAGVAFVARRGVAVLSLLSFSQARELKRLREWAGRAPERAAELEQRVGAASGIRVQRTSTAAQHARPAAGPAGAAHAPGTDQVAAAGVAAAAASAAGPATAAAAAPVGAPATAASPVAAAAASATAAPAARSGAPVTGAGAP